MGGRCSRQAISGSIRGDRIALLGPNGSGKTMLMAMIERAIAAGGVYAVKAAPSIILGHADQSLSHLER